MSNFIFCMGVLIFAQGLQILAQGPILNQKTPKKLYISPTCLFTNFAIGPWASYRGFTVADNFSAVAERRRCKRINEPSVFFKNEPFSKMSLF